MPGVCGGRTCITGSRVRVLDVYVLHELEGRSPDAIVTAFPAISLADVHAALAYYFDHKDEIEKDYRNEDTIIADLKEKLGPGPMEDRKQKKKK